MTGIFIREEDTHTEKQAEIGVTQLYTKECQGLPEATRNQEVKERSSLGPSGGVWLCLHLDFRHSASISERVQIYIVLNHPVCGIYYGRPGKLN